MIHIKYTILTVTCTILPECTHYHFYQHAHQCNDTIPESPEVNLSAYIICTGITVEYISKTESRHDSERERTFHWAEIACLIIVPTIHRVSVWSHLPLSAFTNQPVRHTGHTETKLNHMLQRNTE